MRIPFCVESKSYIGTSVKLMGRWSGRIEEQYCATLEDEGNDKIIAVNGNRIVTIERIIKNNGSGETQLIGVDETVRKLLPKPETFVDDEDLCLSRVLVDIRGRR